MRKATKPFLLKVVSLVIVGVFPGIVYGAGLVQGSFAIPGVTGRPVQAHGWAEENIYVGQLKDGFGAGVRSEHTPPGRFSISGAVRAGGFPAGDYALFSLCYDGMVPFTCRTDIKVPDGSGALDKISLETPAHYSVMYDAKGYEAWGKSPWAGGNDFYQTFVATSPHVTRIGTKLADKSGDHQHLTLDYAVYEPNDGPPSGWKRISPVRSRFLSGGTDPIIHIFWVPYRSNEVKLVPGKTYAVRFWRDPKSQSEKFAMVARTDKGDGYAGGHLFVGDQPRKDLDVYAFISGGEPGTIINHAPVGDLDLKQLIGTAKRHGQTFRASGSSLAGADVIYATGQSRPDSMPFAFQVYDKPGGKAIGPAKTCYGLPLTFQGRAAVVWSKGDVPVTPGRLYYVEWTSPGCNTWQLNEDLPGEAYVDGTAKPAADLAMSIAEYADGKAATQAAN